MGIKGFTTWFLKNFPFVASIIQRNANKTRFFDHIYIDLNQLIHLCARRAKNEEHLFLKVFKELDRLFRLCCPRKSVYLVLDGPASKAKLLEQRKRRKKAASKPSKGKQSFDALQITPGTYFMHRLKNSLCYYVCNRLQKSRRFERVKFYVSGSDVAGEGEIKIVNYIKNKPAYHRSEDSYLIVGTDADLILLGLCVDERNVFVMAERVHEYFLLSVSRLRRYFENSLSTKPRDENTINTTGSSHLDFVLLSFMMGNDYLPKFKGASLPKLWPRYITLKRGEFADAFLYNPSAETFNIPFLQALMTRPRRDKKDDQSATEQKTDGAVPVTNNEANNNNMSINNADDGDVNADENANEDEGDEEKQGDVPEMTAKDEAEVRQWIETHGVQMTDDILEADPDSDNDDIVESSSSDEVFDEEFDDEVVVYGSNWQFQKSEPRPRREPLSREERDEQALLMVQKYLEGLLWCLYTYTKGACADYEWHFEYPFAPGVRDLNYFVYSATQTPNLIKDIRTPYISRDKGPLPPYKFSLSVLPYNANPYLPAPIRPLMEPNGALGELFHLDQKFVDTEKIDSEVSKIPLDQFSAEELRFINFSHVSRFENQFGPKGQHNSRRKFNFRDFDTVPFPPSPKLNPIEPYTRLTCTEVDSSLKPVVHNNNNNTAQRPANPNQPSPRNNRRGGQGGQYVPKQSGQNNSNTTPQTAQPTTTNTQTNVRGRNNNNRYTRKQAQPHNNNNGNAPNQQPSISIRTSETIMQVPVNPTNDYGYTPYVRPPNTVAVNPVEAFIAQQQFLIANNLPPVPWTSQPIYPTGPYNNMVSPQEQYYNNLMAQYQNAFFNNLMRDLNNGNSQEPQPPK